MQKLLKEQRGITLIALVVTIVILIILAAVSMTMVLGNNGIFEQAKKGANSMASAEANTQEGFNSMSSEIDKIISGEEIKPEGMTVVEMFEKAQTDGCDGTNCTDEAHHLHPGDYVDYKNPASGSYTSTGEKTGMKRAKENDPNLADMPDEVLNQTFEVSNETKWRVLGVEEKNGKKNLLLLGSQIKKNTLQNDPYYYLYGANAYLNCEEELDNICKIYQNNLAEEARSARIEDINLACNVVVEGNEVHLKGESTNIDEFGVLGQTQTLGVGKWTPEAILKGEALKEETTVNGSAYGYLYTDTKIKDRVKNMLFDQTDTEPYKKSYWLASPGVSFGSSTTRWGPGGVGGGGAACGNGILCNSYSGEYDVELAVRPVVSLKSEISENQLHKIEDQQEPEFPGINVNIPQ